MPIRLDETQTASLRAAVDRIVPADDRFPGGVEAGALDYLLRNFEDGGNLADRLPDYRAGLDALDRIARGAHGESFPDLSDALQDQTLMRLEQEQPRFFRALVEHVQEGYYTSPVSWEMLGWKVTG